MTTQNLRIFQAVTRVLPSHRREAAQIYCLVEPKLRMSLALLPEPDWLDENTYSVR
jgi:hypothetical protein